MNMFITCLVGGIVLGCTYGMLAMGYSLIYQASGYMNFTLPDLLMLGAFLGWTFFSQLGLPFWLSLLISMALMFLLGVLIERGVIRILSEKKAKPILVVLATIGISIIIQNAANLIWGSLWKFFPPIFADTSPIVIAGVSISKENILAIALALSMMLLLQLFLTKSRFGTAMRAAAQNKTAASCMGINVNLTVSATYGIAAMLACLGGNIIAPSLMVSTSLGTQLGTKSFAGAVIGGYGNVAGAVVGSLLIGVIETFVSAYVTSVYKDLIIYGLMVLVIAVKPSGLFRANVYGS